MAKQKTRIKGMSSTKAGETFFTIQSLGDSKFHLDIGPMGQYYLFEGLGIDPPKNWNDDDVLKALFEIIDRQIFNGEFRNNFYSPIRNRDHEDIPF